ncbi:glycine receptor subunit alpha-3-like [Homarus americanus]|uniref:glycine receptor subunit alpha-3-like n=1 Tax=Homarus americanus TaxID=6706 RepID=UPI001C470548|nr:glycine receptor subunit alpha-3-like [Homarus americanus]
MTLSRATTLLDKKEALLLTTDFHHLYGYYLLSIYMPTLLLVVVSYLSFFFEKDNFSDRMMVSLTALLVLSTFLSTASSNMARVSYFTFIDIWLAFCITFVFLICLCHTTILFFGRPTPSPHKVVIGMRVSPMTRPFSSLAESNHHLAKTDLVCRVTLFLFLTVFIILYFTFGVFIRNFH